MSKYKVIAICGKSASGKDTLLHNIMTNYPWLHRIINCTTRPPRDSERDNIDYHFLSLDEFVKQSLVMNKMIEVTQFREWLYGTSIEDLVENEINIGVFSPSGINALIHRDDIDLYVVQIEASAKVRLLRSLTREDDPDVDEIVRRYLADNKDFALFSQAYEPDYLFENEYGLMERAAREVVLYAQRHWAEEAK